MRIIFQTKRNVSIKNTKLIRLQVWFEGFLHESSMGNFFLMLLINFFDASLCFFIIWIYVFLFYGNAYPFIEISENCTRATLLTAFNDYVYPVEETHSCSLLSELSCFQTLYPISENKIRQTYGGLLLQP